MHQLRRNFRIKGFTLLKSARVSPAHLATGYCFTSVIINLLLTLNTVCAQGALLLNAEHATCQIGSTSDGLQLANCSRTYLDAESVLIVVPADLPSTIEVLDLSNRGGLLKSKISFIKEPAQKFVLEFYPKLKRIIQRNSDQFNHPEYHPDLAFWSYWPARAALAFSEGFSVLDSLEYFEFSNSGVHNIRFPFNFPKNLKTLNMSENILTLLDLKPCSELEEVNLNWNPKLQSVPLFHIPAPPIKALRMKGCPLTKMTIIDIAPLCQLTLLELQFPYGTHYLSEEGYCQCVMLKRWIDLLKLEGVQNLNCKELKPTKSCPEDIFKEAQALHNKCPLLKPGATSRNLFIILRYIFFLILLLLLLATLILYIIRHFHLKEYWAAHHLRMAATLPNVEEEEEPFDEQSSSSSDYSVLSMK